MLMYILKCKYKFINLSRFYLKNKTKQKEENTALFVHFKRIAFHSSKYLQDLGCYKLNYIKCEKKRRKRKIHLLL
jgi:hypothetical protein